MDLSVCSTGYVGLVSGADWLKPAFDVALKREMLGAELFAFLKEKINVPGE